jgi:glucokinase-like ROK family protein
MGQKVVDSTAVRAHNLSRVLNLIRETGSISRTAIVQHTGLSGTTVSFLANDLLTSGFVHESGTGASRGGRPPILLAFDYTFRYLLGIDMGATHLMAVAMDLQARVVARRHTQFDVAGNAGESIVQMKQMAQEVMTLAGLQSSQFLGLGIAIPAPLEGEQLNRLSSQIMPAWAGHDLVCELERAIELPVYLDNDANAGAIAEKWWGQGQAFTNLAYVKLGTGVGGGLILHGEIYRGAGGTAGEIGHTTVDSDGPLCRCGKHGCLESFIGAPALIAEVRHRLNGERPWALPADPWTISDITAAAVAGNPTCRSVIERAGAYLGIALANLVNLINPGLIILGGELALAGDLLMQPVRTTFKQHAMPKAAQEVTIALSRLSHDAVAIGGATIAMHHAFMPARLLKTLKG